jgi:hypothetical protein
MYPFMEAIDVKFCTKCGAVTNSNSAVRCAFCQATLRKLAKISQHAKQPASTNKGVNYLAVLKTFNPVNRDSKYTEHIERGCIDGVSSGPGTEAELISTVHEDVTALPLRSKHVNFGNITQNDATAPFRLDDINNNNVEDKFTSTQHSTDMRAINSNATTDNDKDKYTSDFMGMDSVYGDQDRPKVIARATSSLVMSNSDVSIRALINRTLSSREMSNRDLNDLQVESTIKCMETSEDEGKPAPTGGSLLSFYLQQ